MPARADRVRRGLRLLTTASAESTHQAAVGRVDEVGARQRVVDSAGRMCQFAPPMTVLSDKIVQLRGMRLSHVTICTASTLLLTACTSFTRAYSGPPRSRNDVAILKCGSPVTIVAVENVKVASAIWSQRISVASGTIAVDAYYQSSTSGEQSRKVERFYPTVYAPGEYWCQADDSKSGRWDLTFVSVSPGGPYPTSFVKQRR